VLGFCDSRNGGPAISFRSSQIATIQALVSSGLGISLIPAMAAGHRSEGSPVYVAFRAPRPRRTIVALWPTQRPPGRAAGEFLKLLSARRAGDRELNEVE
jgi:LysR family hydrogen peroxide-inducible transcriptional activator